MSPANTLKLIGRRFGRLLVIERAPSRKGASYWLCQCDCGGSKIIRGRSLQRNVSRSCGCLERESRTTHGQSRNPAFASWKAMKDRCLNRDSLDWKYYGGRGIEVCEPWIASFENFWRDMGDRPPNTSLDRMDNDGNYEPGNCRWATIEMQANNTSRNRRITIGAETKTMAQWAKSIDVSVDWLANRLDKMSPEEALDKQIQRAKPRKPYGTRAERRARERRELT